VFFRNLPHGEIEDLFSHLELIAPALALLIFDWEICRTSFAIVTRGSRFITTTPPTAMDAAPSSARREMVPRIIKGSRNLALRLTMRLFFHDITTTIASPSQKVVLEVNGLRSWL
jgi:hypothetical protein